MHAAYSVVQNCEDPCIRVQGNDRQTVLAAVPGTPARLSRRELKAFVRLPYASLINIVLVFDRHVRERSPVAKQCVAKGATGDAPYLPCGPLALPLLYRSLFCSS